MFPAMVSLTLQTYYPYRYLLHKYKHTTPTGIYFTNTNILLQQVPTSKIQTYYPYMYIFTNTNILPLQVPTSQKQVY